MDFSGREQQGQQIPGASGATWQRYQDPRFGFAVTFPPGWNIQADERAIFIASPNAPLFVLVVPFQEEANAPTNNPGPIYALPAAFGQLFPQAQLQGISQPEPGGDMVGAFVYQSTHGPGQARVLCSRRKNAPGGMLYVIAAPASAFESQRPLLMNILNSLQFGPAPQNPQSAAQPAPAGSAAPAAISLQQIAEAAERLTWTRWSDPREGAFTIDVPSGWTVEGGTFRAGMSDVRQCVRITSLDKEIMAQSGDTGLTLFVVPEAMHLQMGMQEGQTFPYGTGQSTLARYTPPRVFARWYGANLLAPIVGDIVWEKEQELPDEARQQMQAARQQGVPIQVEVAHFEFRGRSRLTGKEVFGELHLTHTLTTMPTGGGFWFAVPLWTLVSLGGPQEIERKTTAGAVIIRLLQSWQESPQWRGQENQQQEQLRQQTHQQTMNAVHQSQQQTQNMLQQARGRSNAIAASGEHRRQATMGAYERRVAAQNETQRHFTNYLGDRTDVRDPNTGQAWSVGSGYNHYYHDEHTDTVLGTNSANAPGVNWTQLHEY